MDIHPDTQNAMCDAAVNRLDGGTLVFYDGTRPADASAALSGNNILCTITLPGTATDAAGTTGDGISVKAGTWSGTCGATGTVTFARAFDSVAGCIAQFTVNVAGGEAGSADPDIIVTHTNWSSSEPVTVTAFQFTQPAS